MQALIVVGLLTLTMVIGAGLRTRLRANATSLGWMSTQWLTGHRSDAST